MNSLTPNFYRIFAPDLTNKYENKKQKMDATDRDYQLRYRGGIL